MDDDLASRSPCTPDSGGGGGIEMGLCLLLSGLRLCEFSLKSQDTLINFTKLFSDGLMEADPLCHMLWFRLCIWGRLQTA